VKIRAAPGQSRLERSRHGRAIDGREGALSSPRTVRGALPRAARGGIAHRHGGYVAGPARPTTWLASIAIGVTSAHRRTRRRRPEHLTDDAGLNQTAPGANPAEAAEAAQALRRVQVAIDAIGADRRGVFVLFELEGEPCDQIAAGLGIPLGTVHSRLHTARREFTAAMDRLHAGEGALRRMQPSVGGP
jgi:RNA polymerase sigma-70 factor (ECF subfamily)